MTEPRLDLTGREIKVGDWIVQPDKGELKMGLVVGFTKKSGNVRAVSFMFGDIYKMRADGKYSHAGVDSWNRLGPYTIQYSNRTFVTDSTRVDPQLLAHIEVELKGDPLYDPEEGQI